MSILTDKKQCRKCGEWKDRSEFKKNASRPDGYSEWCKKCTGEYNRARYVFEKEKINQKKRQWRSDNIKSQRAKERDYRNSRLDKEHEKRKKYVSSHIHKVYGTIRAWQVANHERLMEIQRVWRAANPEKTAAQAENRRARLLGNGGKITGREWRELKEKYNYTCLCCGKREPEIKLTLDHVVPLAKGGTNTIDNAQPLCRNCNSRKNMRIIDYR